MLSSAGVTVSVPPTVVMPVKLAVASELSGARILYVAIVTALLPALVWLPLKVASAVKPVGRPSVMSSSQTSGVPS